MSKIILITGASMGLGESMAYYLYKKGYVVYGASRNIEQHTKCFNTIKMDITCEKSIQAAVERIIQREGQIDILINNAGLGNASPVETLSTHEIKKVLDTNIIGFIYACQAVLPSMRARHTGLIINISSIASEIELPYRGLYSASKAAVDRITEALRIELSPFGVKACVIQPGDVKTNINQNRLKNNLPDDNVYKKCFDRTYAQIEEGVEQGLNPIEFAKLVEELLSTKKLKSCYRLGKPIEKISVALKRILPNSLYESLIRKHYKMKKR